jgi:hypothetical protein
MGKEQELGRLVDTIMYIASLSLSAFRFAKGQDPFDFESLATAEFIMARSLPFIEDENVDYRKAHLDFIQVMVESGWKQGPEDFVNRRHPDLISWEDLSREAKAQYGFAAGIVSSAKSFYLSLKSELESEFMDGFDKPGAISGTTSFGGGPRGTTH